MSENIAYLLIGNPSSECAELFFSKWHAVERLMYALKKRELFERGEQEGASALALAIFDDDGMDFVEVELDKMPDFGSELFITVITEFGYIKDRSGKKFKIKNYKYICGVE